MTKQELLTKLAIDCATWADAMDAVVLLACGSGRRCASYGIAKQDWLAERERLLNKPSWDDAPDGATHLAMDGLIPMAKDSAQWFFYIGEPEKGSYIWLPVKGSKSLVSGSQLAIDIPAGYDWKESLEERPE